MQEENCVLGIDIGTTSVKAVAFGKDFSVFCQAQEELTLITSEENAAEQDPEEIYNKLMNVTTQVLGQSQTEGLQIQAVGFSAAMHSLLLVSEAGEPQTNVFTWADGRAYAQADSLWESKVGRQLYHESGTPVHPMSPLVKLDWLRQQHASSFSSADKYVSLKEWIWHRWFGVWEVDESMASATGLFNVMTRRWNETALDYLGIKEDKLSAVVATDTLRRGCKEEKLLACGIDKSTPFNIGASDGVLANLGIGAVEQGTVALTIGTSIAVRMQSDTPQTHDDVRSFCYILDDCRYIVGGPSNNGGILLDWVNTNFVQGHKPIAQALEECGFVTADELFCFPYISGERAPLWDAKARASFIGLGLHHTDIHCLRAAVEGVLFNAYWIAMELFTQVGLPSVLIASGKLFEVAWIRQLLADVFNLPVRIDSTSDASILGAVHLAQSACAKVSIPPRTEEGYDSWTMWRVPQNTEAQLLHPQNASMYHEKFKVFRRLASHLYSG